MVEWTRDGYTLSDDPALVDRELVHRFLSEESYWVPGISREAVDRAIDHSLVFGLYRGSPEPRVRGTTPEGGRPTGAQVGFARVITDFERLAYLGDVFVLPAERGRGLSTWMVGRILEHPALRYVRRWMLSTDDAHGVYRKLGFEVVTPERAARLMERRSAPDG